MKKISREDVLRVLSYAPETGVFTWLGSPARAVKRGFVAGSVHPSGHVFISINRRLYSAHRLAWLVVHGCWPAQSLDHINGDPSDNRIVNLRELSNTKNLQAARRARSDSRSGLLGACFRKDVNKWQARIQRDKRSTSLGLYASPEEAHLVYLLYKNNF